jgi:2'-5' RNA ligase
MGADDGRGKLFGGFIETKRFHGPPEKDSRTGVMIALYPDEATAGELAVKDGSPPDELHVTVAYLGKTDQVDQDAAMAAAQAVLGRAPVVGEFSGHARFTGGEDGDVLVSLFDSADLEQLRRDLVDALVANGVELRRDHGYTPHMTLGYLEPDDKAPVNRIDAQPVTFGGLAVVYGPDRTDLPFFDPPTVEEADAGAEMDAWDAELQAMENAPAMAEVKIGTPAISQPALGTVGTVDYGKPHSYVRDPQSGAGNCKCGRAESDELHHYEAKGAAFAGAAAPFGKGGDAKDKDGDSGPKVSTGAFVSVGGKKGKVDLVVTSGVVPGAKSAKGVPFDGSKEAPAARVVIYEAAGNGTWKSTGTKVAAAVSSLKRIPPLRTRESKSLAEALAGMVVDYADIGTAPPSVDVLETAYQRGVASWPGESKTALTAEQWGLGRTEALLSTMAGARPAGYVGDDDLIPQL